MLYEQTEMQKFMYFYIYIYIYTVYIYSTLPFTALEVNPTMMTSAAEKPGNVKKVHSKFCLWIYSKTIINCKGCVVFCPRSLQTYYKMI